MWSRIERVARKREREAEREIERDRVSPSYSKLAVESERGERGMTRTQRRSVREDGGGGWGKRWKRSRRWNYHETNCSYKFVRIHSHSSVREIWLVPKSDQLVELMLYRPFSSVSPGTSTDERASERAGSEVRKFVREPVQSLRRSNVINWKFGLSP